MRNSLKLIDFLKICLALSFFSIASSAWADFRPDVNDDCWHVDFAPYLWASRVKGDVTAGNRQAHIDVPFSKILKDLDFAGQAHLEAGRGPWTLMVDATYIKLSKNVTTTLPAPINFLGPLDAGLVSKTGLVDLGGYYRVYCADLNCDQYFTTEILGGARYLGLRNKLHLKLADFGTGPGLTLKSKSNFWAPIVGLRFKYILSPKVLTWLSGDVGGFHVDSVKNTWSATLGLGYNAFKYADIGIAYRILQFKVGKNAANNPRHSNGKLQMQGPMIGVNFHGA